MNTKNNQTQKKQGQVTQQDRGKKKQTGDLKMHHEQEHPETRLTR